MRPRLVPEPDVVWFRGADAVSFLNDLISQEIGTVQPGTVTQSLLLGPQGKLLFIFWVLRGDGEVGLVTEDGRGGSLLTTLSRYRIRVDVDISIDEDNRYLVAGELTVEPGTWVRTDGVLKADLSWESLPRELRIGGERPDLHELPGEDYDLARIEAGRPLMEVDVDEKTIPQETGLVAKTISFDKGCFLGQELVARLDSRGGRVNRHLRILDFDSPVAAGTSLRSGDKDVGTVTTTSGDKGLALVWREVEPGDRIEADGVGGTVRPVP
jgi:folate-binding protein YgfZ